MAKLTKRSMAYDYLVNFIDNHLFLTDNKIPSENELAKELGLSRSTVRKAVLRLSATGIIYKRQGSGSFFDREKFIKFYTKTQDLQIKNKAIKATVVLIVQGQDGNASQDLRNGLKSVFDNKKVILKTYKTDNKFVNERFCLESLFKSTFDALIVDGVKASLLNPNLFLYKHCLTDLKLPIIFYNNYYKELDYPHVVMNDKLCATKLINILISKGHRNIAGIFVCDNYQAVEKFQGMYTTLLENNMPLHDDNIKWCVSDDAHTDKFQKDIEKFLMQIEKCTAIVCCNSIIYHLLSKTLQKLYKKLDRKIEIVAFDLPESVAIKDKVTCSVYQGFNVGKKIATNLLAMLDDVDFSDKITSYSCTIDPIIYINGQKIS